MFDNIPLLIIFTYISEITLLSLLIGILAVALYLHDRQEKAADREQ